MIKKITEKYLRKHPTHIFVFGDNTLRKGKAGGALLRDEPNTYGFITKRFPNNTNEAFFDSPEDREVFFREFVKLTEQIITHPRKIYLLSRCGAGLANRFGIWSLFIKPAFINLKQNFKNVILLFEEDA